MSQELIPPSDAPIARPSPSCSLVPAGRAVLFLALGYLALLAVAEALATGTAVVAPWAGGLACGAVLLLLLLHTVLCWDRPWRLLPALLCGAAVLRLALWFVWPAGAPPLFLVLALGLPVLAAAVVLLRFYGLPPAPGARLAAGWARCRQETAALHSVAARGLGGCARLVRALVLPRRMARIWRWSGSLLVVVAALSRCAAARGAALGRRAAALAAALCARLAEQAERVGVLPGALLVLAVVAGLGAGRGGPLGPAALAAAAGRPGPGQVQPLPLGSAFLRTAASAWEAQGAAQALLADAALSLDSAVPWQGAGRRLALSAPAVPLPTRLRLQLPPAHGGAVLPAAEQWAPAGRPPPRPEPTPAPAWEPLPPECPGVSDANHYPRAVCTWYAKEMRPDLPWFRDDYGLAVNWPQAASLCGFQVDGEPAAGAVVVFPPWANGAFEGGHVAYVEEVEADSVLISECNVDHASAYIVPRSRWWDSGYPCAYRRIPRERLHPGVRYIHGRVEPDLSVCRDCQ